MIRFGVLLALVWFAGAAYGQVLAESRFDFDMDGWAVIGDPATGFPRWEAEMGVIPGCIRTVDAQQGESMVFQAPAGYRGDKLAAYRGTFSFFIRNDAGAPTLEGPLVMLDGAGIHLVCRARRAEYNWGDRIVIQLDERAAPPHGEWYVGNFSGPAPTRCEFRSVLAALDSLQVNAEFRNGADDVRFDEVRLEAGSRDCPADINLDGSIDLIDLAVVLAHFGSDSGAVVLPGDLDCDHQVGIADLAILLAGFGTTCS